MNIHAPVITVVAAHIVQNHVPGSQVDFSRSVLCTSQFVGDMLDVNKAGPDKPTHPNANSCSDDQWQGRPVGRIKESQIDAVHSTILYEILVKAFDPNDWTSAEAGRAAADGHLSRNRTLPWYRTCVAQITV